MRHRLGFKQLSRSSSERKSLLRSQVTSLLTYEKIVTTSVKASATRRLAEKVITRARNANAEIKKLTAEGSAESLARAKAINVHAHRMVSRYVYTEKAVAKVFTEIAPLFESRNGGYTRMLKIGNRANDSAELVLLELVEKTVKENKESSKDKKKKKTTVAKSADKAPAKQPAARKAPEAKVQKGKAVTESKVSRQKKGSN